MAQLSPLEIRRALQAAGYSPIPLMGKRPTLAEWQTKQAATLEEMLRWAGANTGALTAFTPALDIDITHPEAADGVENIARGWFDGRDGVLPVRFGHVPKRAILFRTTSPFPKIVQHYLDTAGRRHKIEILGDGQQLAVHGLHPDTKAPWTWHGGVPWSDVPHSELVEVDEKEMRDFLALVTETLASDFGFEIVDHVNGGDERRHHADERRHGGERRPVDVEIELGAMVFGGGEVNGIHHSQLRCTASLLRNGMAVDQVVDEVFAATEKAAAGQAWNWDEERRGIERMCLDFVKNNPEIVDALPDGIREQFKQRLSEGQKPFFTYNKALGRWTVRAWHREDGPPRGDDYRRSRGWEGPPKGAPRPRGSGSGKGTGGGDGGAAAAEGLARGPAKGPKPGGWKYYDTTKPEPPRWAVKNIIPETGVGILAGQWGSYKTTVALDLSTAVMTGQPFAGKYRIKRPGAVLYIAAEGSGTIQARLAALAAARGAPAQLPFAWRGDCPSLADRDTAKILTGYVQEASDHFQEAYGLPVTLLWVDTWSQTSGLDSGEDNDTAAVGKALKTLRMVSEQAGVFVIAVDHYGKVLEAGTRGSSNKEGSTDTVLASLAERELSGAVANTRLAVRKQRDGQSGFEISFNPQVTEIGIDEDGDPETAITVDWGEERLSVKVKRSTKAVRVLQQALKAVIDEHGFMTKIEDRAVNVVPVSVVRTKFEDLWLVTSEVTAEQKVNTKRKAFRRALEEGVEATLVAVRDVGGQEVIWLC